MRGRGFAGKRARETVQRKTALIAGGSLITAGSRDQAAPAAGLYRFPFFFAGSSALPPSLARFLRLCVRVHAYECVANQIGWNWWWCAKTLSRVRRDVCAACACGPQRSRSGLLRRALAKVRSPIG